MAPIPLGSTHGTIPVGAMVPINDEEDNKTVGDAVAEGAAIAIG